jgi:hypothetical protein
MKNISETWYYEITPGKYTKKYYNRNSVYISSGAMVFISDCLHRANNNYDDYRITEYSKKKGQVQLLVEELKIRLADIIEDKDLICKFESRLGLECAVNINNEIKKSKTEIIELINGLINWIESLEEDKLTIIGIDRFFSRVVLDD